MWVSLFHNSKKQESFNKFPLSLYSCLSPPSRTDFYPPPSANHRAQVWKLQSLPPSRTPPPPASSSPSAAAQTPLTPAATPPSTWLQRGAGRGRSGRYSGRGGQILIYRGRAHTGQYINGMSCGFDIFIHSPVGSRKSQKPVNWHIIIRTLGKKSPAYLHVISTICFFPARFHSSIFFVPFIWRCVAEETTFPQSF